MEKIPTLHKLITKKIKHTANLRFSNIMEINLIINEFICYCITYKVKEVDIDVLTNYWSRVFILLLKLQQGELLFNYSAKLDEQSCCYFEDKKLHARFIFLNFLGNIIFVFSKYDILLWYKVGKVLGVNVDNEIEELINQEKNGKQQ